jgi:hypothetical protein
VLYKSATGADARVVGSSVTTVARVVGSSVTTGARVVGSSATGARVVGSSVALVGARVVGSSVTTGALSTSIHHDARSQCRATCGADIVIALVPPFHGIWGISVS